jgi:hypothetical protein
VDYRAVVEADVVRSMLVALDARQLSCSAAYRNRLQGVVVVLEGLVGVG